MTLSSDIRDAWKAIRRGLSWGLLAVVAGLGLAVLAIPVATGSTPLAVLTASMEPTLPPGTLVVVRPTPVEDVRLGDVLTYQIRPGEPAVVSHRVVEIHSISNGETEFITKGDNNAVADAKPVSAEQVKGIVWYSVPFVGWASMTLGSYGPWLAPLVGVGLLVYGAFLVGSGALARLRRSRDAAPALQD